MKSKNLKLESHNKRFEREYFNPLKQQDRIQVTALKLESTTNITQLLLPNQIIFDKKNHCKSIPAMTYN